MFNLSNIIKKPLENAKPVLVSRNCSLYNDKTKTSFTETAKPSHEQVSFQFHPEPSKTNYSIKRRQVQGFYLLLSILL